MSLTFLSNDYAHMCGGTDRRGVEPKRHSWVLAAKCLTIGASISSAAEADETDRVGERAHALAFRGLVGNLAAVPVDAVHGDRRRPVRGIVAFRREIRHLGTRHADVLETDVVVLPAPLVVLRVFGDDPDGGRNRRTGLLPTASARRFSRASTRWGSSPPNGP